MQSFVLNQSELGTDLAPSSPGGEKMGDPVNKVAETSLDEFPSPQPSLYHFISASSFSTFLATDRGFTWLEQ